MIQEAKKLNIKDMVMPEFVKRSDQSFNPKRDISIDDLQIIDKLLEKELSEDNAGFEFQRAIRILAPDKIPPNAFATILKIDHSAPDFSGLTPPNSGFAGYIEKCATLELLSPGYPKNKNLINDKLWEDFTDTFERYAKNNALNKCYVYQFASFARILDPENTHNFSVDWEEARNTITRKSGVHNWKEIAEIVSELKFFDPTKINNLGLKEDDWGHIWEYFHKELNDSRVRERPLNLVDTLSRMAIISAKDVKVTHNGVKLIYDDSDDLDGSKPMPERRRF
jgi:hypothetical protein